MRLALCRDIDNIKKGDRILHPMFEAYEENKDHARAVDAMCLSCPVQKQCLTYGMANKQEGCWGGVYLNEQGRPEKNANSHKTSEDWSKVNQRVGFDVRRKRQFD